MLYTRPPVVALNLHFAVLPFPLFFTFSMKQPYSSWLTRRLPRPLAALGLLLAAAGTMQAQTPAAPYPTSGVAPAGPVRQTGRAADPTLFDPAKPTTAPTPAAARTTATQRLSTTWTTMAPMSQVRAEPGATAHPNGKIYVWGGYDSNQTTLASAEAYTPSTNTWTAIASLPQVLCGPATAVGTDGSIYTFGGRDVNAGYLGNSYKYNVATNTWASIAPLPVVRWEARALTASDGRIIVFGGWNPFLNNPAVGTEVQIYTPATNTWSMGAAMPVGLFGSAAGVDAAGLMHVYGGISNSSNTYPPSTVHLVYNVAANSWATAPATPTPARAYTTGLVGSDGNLYLFGGDNDIPFGTAGTYYNQVDSYNPTTATWSSEPALPVALTEAASAASGGDLYVLGGFNGTAQSALYRIAVAAAPTLTNISPNPAPVGTSVTLTGTNLTGATGVSFNGTAATTVAVVNATTVTATVPSGATSGPVTVTTPGGTSNGVVFTVLASAPVLANIEPSVLPYTPSQGAVQITSTLTVSDTDSPTLPRATVSIGAGFVANQDQLSFTPNAGLSGTYNFGTGVLTINGTASLADYQAALRSVTFSTPTATGDRVIQFTATDGTNTSNALTRTVRVTAVAPTVATTAPTTITTTSAVLGGNATADGGAAITDRGVVYSVSSTNAAPTIGGTGVTKDANGTGTGAFSKTITGLLPGTAYTVRAYATNSAGTSYGSPVSFTTVANTSVVSINRVGSSPTNAGSVSYTVTFAAAVTGLSTSNFALATTGSVTGASITGVSGAGTTYTVAVNTGTGDGTLGLNLVNATGTSPGLSNTLPFVGQVYTIDKTAPTVTITSTTAPDGGYTTTSPLTFVITFSEAVTGYDLNDVISSITNITSGQLINNSATTYTLVVSSANNGALTLRVSANAATDAAGNGNTAAPVYTIYYNVPTAAPVVTAPANNSTSATGLPTYTGTGTAGSTVTVYVDGTSIGTTTATGGSFSLTQPTALAQGAHTVYATAQASGQLVSANSNTNTFTVASAPTITLLSPSTGPVGTQVTITGTNLAGAMTVRFNGTAASSFVINSATSITAVVAAGTTTGLVTVTTPSGTATSATPFVVRVAPTTVADAYSTPAGITLTGNVLSNDLGTNPRAILITRPANGTLVLNPNGSFTYQPNAGFTGTDSFTYYACDPNMPLLCGNPATVSITVLRIAPVTVADAYTTPQNVTLTGNVLSNDLGTNPRALLITRPTRGTLVLNPDGTFNYQPNAGYVGADSFTYYACDPNLPLLCGNPATVSITVTRVAPTTVADFYSTPQGVTLTGNVLSNDIGTNPVAILINRPTHGTVVLNPNGSFSYQPRAGFSGADSFTYYACNTGTPLVCGDPATVSITVTPAANTRVAASPSAAPAPASSATAAATAAKPAATAATGAIVRLELMLTGHPNPFSEELQLSFTLPIAQAYTLAVYDAQGRLVQQLANGQAEASQTQQLTVPTRTYAAGLYLVRLTTATGTQQLKLIKQ